MEIFNMAMVETYPVYRVQSLVTTATEDLQCRWVKRID
jgi:hypothetical protein